MSLKRKATHSSVLHMETPDAKRRRGPTEEVANATETPQRTSEYGLEFLQKLRNSHDKHGSLIAKHFETLPDPNEYPDYYEQIKLPIAIDTVEGKLRRYEYANMSTVEADLKRMIKNAKTYNEKTAEAYNDAEKIRKMMSNSMKSINPAYADPSYQVDATPLPGEAEYESPLAETPVAPIAPVTPMMTPTSSVRPRRSLTLNGPRTPLQQEAVSQPPESPAVAGGSFQGKTFQQAQEMIIEELIDMKNDEGENISYTFHNKPKRSLKEYYETIKRPQSLKSIRKQVAGWISNKDGSSGITNYKSWAEFEADCNLIWDNAREFNEDESEIVELAGQLETYFKRRLSEAKQHVSEPSQPKIKLKMSAKSPDPPVATTPSTTSAATAAKLTLNGPKPATGVSVDEGALRRQQELVKAGVGGTAGTPKQPSADVRPPNPSTSNQPSSSGVSQSPPHTTNGIKVESQNPAPQSSPSLAKAVPNGVAQPGSMGPPSLVRSSPSTAQPVFSPSNGLTEVVNNRFRAPGKTATDGILSDVEIYSHPGITGLDPADRFNFIVEPSEVFTQQSFTFYVSHQHLWLQLHTIKKKIEGMRQLHLYCFVDNKKVQPSHPESGPGKEIAQPGQMTWQIPLPSGVMTRIELHTIAAPIRGAPKQGNHEVEFEKVTFMIQRELDPSDHTSAY